EESRTTAAERNGPLFSLHPYLLDEKEWGEDSPIITSGKELNHPVTKECSAVQWRTDDSRGNQRQG
ncbi:hypothetical protein, partial [Rossellomorea marisflavi]|uniref:hypothetical protein n=1 Tax=Rossellomorea marisflavi TaxID=189381 RepID=UPI00295F2432